MGGRFPAVPEEALSQETSGSSQSAHENKSPSPSRASSPAEGVGAGLEDAEVPFEQQFEAEAEAEAEGGTEPAVVVKTSEKAPSVSLPPLKRRFSPAVLVAVSLLGILGLTVGRLRKGLSVEALAKQWASVTAKQEASWELQDLDQFEVKLPNRLEKSGKKVLAEVVKQIQEQPYTPSETAREALAELARRLSGGQKKEIVGVSFVVKGVPVDRYLDEEPELTSNRFTVSRVFGEGDGTIFLEVTDGEREPMAMRLHLCGRPGGPAFLSETLAEMSVLNQIKKETNNAIRACGSTDPEKGEDRGLAMPLVVGELEGLPSGISLPNGYFLSSRVVLSELRPVDLGSALRWMGNPSFETREYAALRLLLAVLHLQRAGISHNNLKLDNLLLGKDGDVQISEFTTVTAVGETLSIHPSMWPAYCEPQLVQPLFLGSNEKPVVDAKSDMYSLGMNLYLIFMNGEAPYEIDIQSPAAREVSRTLQRNMSVNTLIPHMRNAGIPDRWQSLMMDLLQIHRSTRLGPEEVIEKYSDLLE